MKNNNKISHQNKKDLITRLENNEIIELFEHKTLSFIRKFIFYPIVLCLFLYFIYMAFALEKYETIIFWLIIFFLFLAAFLMEIFKIQEEKPNLILSPEGFEDLLERENKNYGEIFLWKNIQRSSLVIESYFPLRRGLDLEVKNKENKSIGIYIESKNVHCSISELNKTFRYFMKKNKN